VPDYTVPPPPGTWTTVALCAVIGLVGGIGFLVAVASGQAVSALIVVGLPTLLALVLAGTPRSRSSHWTTFKGLTIGLSLAAVLLRDDIICLILAAPLVYGVGHLITAGRTGRRRRASAPGR
jgi:hypothetical protein